jgi:signal transduction histidine kinase
MAPLGAHRATESHRHHRESIVHHQIKTLQRIFWITGITWTFVLTGVLAWQIHSIRSMNWETATREARANFNKDQAFRLWASGHGGVYVPITPATPPNPYLDHVAERDITTASGKQLTLMNPAYMIRQLNEQFRELYGVVGHITSAKLLREHNAPDDWEYDALARFERGETEVVSVATIDDKPYMRVMQPMIAEASCLKCHGHQGYKEGDIRGGVSAAVPLAPYLENMRSGAWLTGASIGGIWCMGILGLVVAHRRLRSDAIERLVAEDAVRVLNAELEQRVEQRTEELRSANAALRTSLEHLHNAQHQLVETEKMAALGELVAGVAHEINTPVGIGVTAASHLEVKTKELAALQRSGTLRRSDLDKYVATATESCDALLSNLHRAAELIRSFKQVAVDQSAQERRTFPVKDYLEGILLSLRPQLKKTRHTVTLDCPRDLLLDSYPGALSQIITNLVMNALIHAYADKEDGQIDIRVTDGPDDIELRFRDDGCGMTTEQLRRLYEPFYTTRRGDGASGLGLHIVYNLVTQRLGGRIECESAPGQGTAFTLWLPKPAKVHVG